MYRVGATSRRFYGSWRGTPQIGSRSLVTPIWICIPFIKKFGIHQNLVQKKVPKSQPSLSPVAKEGVTGMCGICDGVAPKCGWILANCVEDFFAGWEDCAIPCDDDWEEDS
jgi:hypothetical protein